MKHVFTEYSDSLATIIQEETLVSITTDGTKSRLQSGDGWVITSSVGKIVAHGENPDLDSMDNIHFNRSEEYDVLSVFFFLSEYSKYFSLPFNNNCTLYCDNKERVKKIQKITTTNNHFKPYYKISEYEAIIAIQHYLPQRIQVIHLYSHQDKIKGKDKLTFPEKLKDLGDTIADTYARSPLNNHILFTPFATISPTTINTTFVDSAFNKTQMNI